MPKFDDEQQKKQLDEIRREEEESLVQMLSQKYELKYLNLTKYPINTDALRMLPEDTARKIEAAVVDKKGKKLTLAVRSPNKQEVTDLINNLKERGFSVELGMASQESLGTAFNMYKDLSYAVEEKAGVVEISGDEIKKLLVDIQNIQDVRNSVEDVLQMKGAHRVSKVLEVILAGAIFVGTSDIHLEPEEEYVRLRYRMDGVLTDVVSFDASTYKLLLSRVKLLSNLKLNTAKIAQDGRFSITIDDADTEVRTSIIPDAYGESIVMRLLNAATIKLSLEDLGIETGLLKILQKEIKRPNGMILTTGPTGSGKTTTLYAFITTIHKPEIKILTIEDPTEYHIPGIVQTQIEGKKYTFASGLRAALRQDPDVIMVGEIRDHEVAETAVHAALTGHLVFSTLHTNSAAGSFPRLIDIGMDPKIIGSAVNVMMAQRLIRKLCKHCKKETKLSGEKKAQVDKIFTKIIRQEVIPKDTTTIWEPVGCDKCNDLGFKGRIGLYEAILMDDGVKELLPSNPTEEEILEVSNKQGILSMRQDGLLKVFRGITSISEVERVLPLDN